MRIGRRLALLRTPVLLAAGLVSVALVLRLLPSGGAGLGAQARAEGPVWFVVSATLACTVGVPRQVACFAGGYAFGFWEGSALALAAETLGCIIDLAWARAVARDWVRRRFGHRLGRIDRLLARRPFEATLSLRLMPVGNNLLLNLAVGVSLVPAVPFVAASLVGYIPQTVVFALLGSGVGMGTGQQLVLGVALFAASAVLGFVVLRSAWGAGAVAERGAA